MYDSSVPPSPFLSLSPLPLSVSIPPFPSFPSKAVCFLNLYFLFPVQGWPHLQCPSSRCQHPKRQMTLNMWYGVVVWGSKIFWTVRSRWCPPPRSTNLHTCKLWWCWTGTELISFVELVQYLLGTGVSKFKMQVTFVEMHGQSSVSLIMQLQYTSQTVSGLSAWTVSDVVYSSAISQKSVKATPPPTPSPTPIWTKQNLHDGHKIKSSSKTELRGWEDVSHFQ